MSGESGFPGIDAKTTGRTESMAVWLQNQAILLLFLGLLTFVLYVGTLTFPFVWDDNPQIVNNPIIRTWSNVPRAFGSDLWYHTTRQQVYYRPLFTSWSTLNYSLFALDPWGWHLGAVLAHILAVVAVFFLARKMSLEYWTAGTAALLFALHPVHIECVAWISAASDAMVTIFFVLAFLAFLNSREPEQKPWFGWRAASILLLLCALLTKEMALTFCVLVGFYAYLYPPAEVNSKVQALRQSLFVALPYGAVTVVYLLLRRFALHHVTGSFDPRHGFIDMLRTWPLVLYKYLKILTLPVGLTGLYYDPYVRGFDVTRFLLPLLLVAGVAAGIWYWSRRTGDRLVRFAGLWMVVTLLPALYLRNFGNGDFVRDRYIYLPSVGFVVLLAKAIFLLPDIKSFRSLRLRAAAVGALALGYCVGTYAQEVYWASELLIFSRGHSLYPSSDYAALGLAKELSRRGGYDRAIELIEGVIKNHPDNDRAYFSLAETYIRANRMELGREMLDRAVALSHGTLTSETSKIDLAGLYSQLGDYDRALALCSQVLQQDPNLYSALYDCGNTNFLSRRYADAESLLSRAVLAAPGQAGPNYFLGRVYFQTGRTNEAEASFRKAVALDPGIYDYHYWYGRALALRGDVQDARREFQAALAVKSDGIEAKASLQALSTAP